MKKIEVGHLIRVFNDDITFTGVVVGIEDFMDNTFLKYINLKVYDAQNKEACMVCSSSPYYVNGKFSIVFVMDVDSTHVKSLQKLYKENHEKPDDIKPNSQYNNGIEIYVKTKKDWFTLIRTTARMAFFDGGRCALSNISDIRKKQ